MFSTISKNRKESITQMRMIHVILWMLFQPVSLLSYYCNPTGELSLAHCLSLHPENISNCSLWTTQESITLSLFVVTMSCIFLDAFIFAHAGFLLLCTDFLQLKQAGATFHCSVWASHYEGFSYGGAQALGYQASVAAARGLSLWLKSSRALGQWLWYSGSVALQHVGSSRTRGQNSVPCTARWILNH